MPPLLKRVLSRIPKLLPIAIAFSPAIVLVILIGQNGVNIPVYDGWERTELFMGPLTFAELYAPHIDHRMVFPRLLMIGLAHLGDGDLRWEMVASFGFGVAAAIGIWKLARATLGENSWGTGAAFLCNLWIFSPMQYDNWLWAYQIAFLMPMACLVWALWVTIQPWAWWKKWLLAGVLAIIGTHSFSHGLFIWPAVFFLALLLPGFKKKPVFLVAFAALAVAILVPYFTVDYEPDSDFSYLARGTDDTPLVWNLKRFLGVEVEDGGREIATAGDLREFFLTTLSGPAVRQFAIDPFPPGKMIGILMLAGYLFCGGWAVFLAWKRGDRETWAKALPWLALGGAVVAIALGFSLGRAGILAQARSTVPRMLSVTLYLPVTFLALAILFCRDKKFRLPNGTGIAIFAVLITLQIQPWLYGARLMELWRISRHQGQAQVQFIEHFTPEPIRILAHLPPSVQRYAPILDERGWLDPPLVKSLDLADFKHTTTPLPPSKGILKSSVPGEKEGTWELSGTTLFHSPSRPAEAVVITMEHDGLNSPRIIGLADFAGTQLPTRHRIDIQFTVLWEQKSLDPGTWSNWREVIDFSGFPEGKPVILQAWAFLKETDKFYPLANFVEVAADGSVHLVEQNE
ncbi:MAG: hypothetical protein HKN23_14780 [Verrucomicrobiales bacterium]|nr:hypothetical protein [Verrucomicrobiales bacterium]